MSININENNLPDVQELERLANQFFKEAQGSPLNTGATAPPQQPVPAVSQQFAETPYVSDLSLRGPNGFNSQPPSLPGFGASSSALTQANAFNIQEPQTSFDDPLLKSSSPAPDFRPNSDRFQHPVPYGLFALPFQEEQSYQKELRGLFDKITRFPTEPQIPFGNIIPAIEPSFYFLNKAAITEHRGVSDIVTPPFDVNLVRQDFPILKEQVNGKQLVWFDNAATTQKPRQVIDRISYFYEHENSNIHRAAHELAARATDAYEGARKKVQVFLNAASPDEIIFVRGATEAINLVAKSWGEQYLQAGDEIIVSHLEHHANIVPWQQLANKKGLKIRVIPVDDDGQVIIAEYLKLLGPKTKLVSFTQVSNALGTVTPAAEIVRLGHLAGAKVLVDGAQSVSHMRVNVQALDADWFVLSGHKMFAPTGIGVLYGKEDLLNETQPWQGGGNMIVDVTFEHTKYHNAPGRFEAGTGNIADAVGLGAAVDYLTRIGMPAIAQYEHYLLVYATERLKEVPGLRLIGTAAEKASVLSFVLEGYHTEEVGTELNKQGIAVRSGHHCAQPILRRFGLESTVRPSLAFYNTCAEVDLLVKTLHGLKK